MSYLLKAVLSCVLVMAGTISLTLLVEFPIVYFTGIVKQKRYIVAVNALTNVCLNVGIVLIYLTSMDVSIRATELRVATWTLLAEAILIPVAETVIYLMISKKSAVKVLLITYLANFASFFVGLFAVGLYTGEGFSGISNFFMYLFGGMNG